MTQVTVLVDDAHLRSIGTVAHALAGRGMRVDTVLPAIGAITGSVPSTMVIAALRTIPGVLSVDPRTTYRLAPPGSAVQ